jgi:hypothetical protein
MEVCVMVIYLRIRVLSRFLLFHELVWSVRDIFRLNHCHSAAVCEAGYCRTTSGLSVGGHQLS